MGFVVAGRDCMFSTLIIVVDNCLIVNYHNYHNYLITSSCPPTLARRGGSAVSLAFRGSDATRLFFLVPAEQSIYCTRDVILTCTTRQQTKFNN